MFIAQLAVVFLGITGDHAEGVQRQIGPLMHAAHVKRVLASEDEIVALTHHTAESREIVKHLDADGVIAGEMVVANHKTTLRFVIYGHEGIRRSFNETPLVNGMLTREDLEVFATNLDGDVADLVGSKTAPKPAPAAPAIVVARAIPSAPPKAAMALVAAKPAPASTDDEREAPPGLDATPAATKHEAAPTETASVSLDEIEEMTGGGGSSTAVTTEVEPGQRANELHLHAGVGIGLAGRGFAPGPSTVTGFSTSPVGQVRFDAGIEPTKHTSLEVLAERSLAMTTPLSDGMATTTMSRWEVTGGYTLHGAIDVTPVLGLGHRSFAIQSADPSRTPDNDYRYVIVGARFAKPIGDKVTLRANVAFEPVTGGMEPTEMAFGDAQRWAFAVGGALDIRPISHVFARVGFDWQRFSWSWNAGPRGAGGAVDSYPTGIVTVGAEY